MRTRIRMVGLALLAGCTAMPALSQERSKVGRSDYARARKVLQSFDAAWSRGDVDALMETMSSDFGCALYDGGIDYDRLYASYREMLEDTLAGSRCETKVLSLADDGNVIQAYICRQFLSQDGEVLEEQCLITYLRRESSDLLISGLEEYGHAGFESIHGDEYRSSTGLLSFEVPKRCFIVPRPLIGFALEDVFVRGLDLRTEIRVYLLQTRVPFELEKAFDDTMTRFEADKAPAKVELRTATEVAGYPAMRAEARYYDLECALAGRDGKRLQYRCLRTWVQLDEQFLLAIDLRCPKSIYEQSAKLFDGLVESLRFEVPEGKTYGQAVSEILWDEVTDNRFVRPEAGFKIQAPADFSMEVSERGSSFSIRAHRLTPSASTILINGGKLVDPSTSLKEMIAIDDDVYLRNSRQKTHIVTSERLVDGHTSVQVDRHPAAPASDRFESVIYLRSPESGYLFTVQIVGTLDEIKRTSKDLDTILQAIKLDSR